MKPNYMNLVYLAELGSKVKENRKFTGPVKGVSYIAITKFY